MQLSERNSTLFLNEIVAPLCSSPARLCPTLPHFWHSVLHLRHVTHKHSFACTKHTQTQTRTHINAYTDICYICTLAHARMYAHSDAQSHRNARILKCP